MKKYLYLTILLSVLTALIIVATAPFAYATTTNSIQTITPVIFYFHSGASFNIQSINPPDIITVTVTSGTLYTTGLLTLDNNGGSLILNLLDDSTATVTSDNSSTIIKLNGDLITGEISLSTSTTTTVTITWQYGLLPVQYPETLNLTPFWQFLFAGDFLGFLMALFLSAFGIMDLVVGVVIMLFLVPLYIRTKSLLLLCIVWILLGSTFIVAMPIVSGLAVVFLALGIGGLIWRLVHPQ